MYERYHIHVTTAPGRHRSVPKFLVARATNCINCGKCERACVYGVHKRSEADPRKMSDPMSQFCKNCFRCVVECPQRALSLSLNDEFKGLGTAGWTPQRVQTIWNESEAGKIPVFGAGYRGMFAGPGFDAMWTDMSEIVRPTRDGIHGRESISTIAILGRNPSYLAFDAQGKLLNEMAPSIELQVPFIMDATRLILSPEHIKAMLAASSELKTLFLLDHGKIKEMGLDLGSGMIVPVLNAGININELSLPQGVRFVEIEMSPNWTATVHAIRKARPDLIIGLRVLAESGLESSLPLIAKDVDVIHVLFQDDGRESNGRYARDALRAYHRSLVRSGSRDQVTLISGGGIAAAEHVPKSIICGADVVALERAMLVSIGCRACPECKEPCPSDVSTAPSNYVTARVVNLGNAWRDQMLEMLGAMGIKEVRRLRGEMGRAIFQEDAEREAFAGMYGGDVIG